MRTLWTEFRFVTAALAVLIGLTAARAEEHSANLHKKIVKLNAVTGMDPIRGEVTVLLGDKAATRELIAEAARLTKEKPQFLSYNATLILATAAVQLEDYANAERFYRQYRNRAKKLGSVKGLITGYTGLLTALLGAKKYAEGEKVCNEALEHPLLGAMVLRLQRENDRASEKALKDIEDFLFLVRREQILSIAFQDDSDRAVEIIDKIFKNPSRSWLALRLKGQVYRITGENEQAVKIYEAELKLLQEDKKLDEESKESLVSVTRYALSGVYVETKQIDKAAEQLKALLAKEPDNPTYNNDLGYIWADHNMNLDESEKLIRKAIDAERKKRKAKADFKSEEDKDNPAYLDSLGWVLYKQKKYEEAKKYLQQAVEQEEGKHVEIFDHLGDTLLALGQKSEAVDVWKKSLKISSESKREQKRKEEVRKKIKANE